LTGWDNLHPEFNFGLNIYRSIFSVWQEYQGLGLLAGMAHASDLPRQLFLLLTSFVLPSSSLRYVFHFLMLLVGTLGIYTFIEGFFLRHKDEDLRQKTAFLGALFYLLNLGTIQYFFVPFEPYSTFWGFFPWELFVFFKLLNHPSKKNVIIFTLVNFLAVPQAYVQTLFLVYLLCLGSIIVGDIVLHKSLIHMRSYLKLLLIIFCVNAFWLIPNAYFTFKNVLVTQQAMNNQMNNERFFQINKKRGTIQDFALLKEFYFDFINSETNSKDLGYMMQPWRDHYKSQTVTFVGYALFVVVIFGLFGRNKNNKYLWGIFALACLAFLSDTPLFADLNNIIRSIPLINQIFRNPFTKFIVPTVFVFSVFFSAGVSTLVDGKILRNHRKTSNIFLSILFVCIVVMGYPIFRGYLFYSKSRLVIPDKYFKLFNYFASQDKNARIMNMPQDSYWGWGSYRWGAIGSGFLWYGIEQPIMDRAFDVWSKPLEGYYWELNYALKKQDIGLFNQVLQKYNIKYIIFDESYIPSDSMPLKFLLKQEGNMLFNNTTVQKKFEVDGIRVYEISPGIESINNIVLIDKLPSVDISNSFDNIDTAFSTLGIYKSPVEHDKAEYVFPFQSLFTNRPQIDSSIQITEDDKSYNIMTPLLPGNYNIQIPSSINQNEKTQPVNIYAKKDKETLTLLFKEVNPRIFINTTELKEKQYAITTEFQVKGNVFIVDINNKDFFPIHSLKNQLVLIGSAYLDKDSLPNEVNIYSVEQGSHKQIGFNDFSATTVCNKQLSDEAPPAEVSASSGLILKAKSHAVCATYQASLKGISSTSLNHLSFSYNSSQNELPHYCYFNSIENTCLNDNIIPRSGFSQQEKGFSEYFESNSVDSSGYLTMIVDPGDNAIANHNGKIQYNNIQFASYPLIASATITSEQLNHLSSLSWQNIDIPAQSEMIVQFPKLSNSKAINGIISQSLYKKSGFDHNKLLEGETNISERDENGVKSLRLLSEDNFLNFWINLPEWDNGNSYLISTDMRRLSGMRPIVNISSMSNKYKYVNTFVPAKNTLTKNYYLIGPNTEFDKGLQILFNASSFNQIPTVFEIKDVSITPLPYSFLSQIKLQKADVNPIINGTIPIVSIKSNVPRYDVQTDYETKSTIVLMQSFHEGWIAYEVYENNTFAQLFPSMNGREIKEHILINNWANGWELSPRKHNVVIIFWPQYLEFIGFGLLGLTLLGILTYRQRE
ncbi:hypothetical protein COY90_02445, partial [Candidatus Roizmanbacteria bacterium CG_4_10_14_0_8_um_filter_39_9]